MPAQALRQLATVPGVTFHSLQFGAEALPWLGMVDAMGAVRDFADTAALTAGLDLVITIDTSWAHIAASLGKPTWILLAHDADWRWLKGRTDSPWYPSARLFRQPAPGDWASVLREVEAARAAWLSTSRASP